MPVIQKDIENLPIADAGVLQQELDKIPLTCNCTGVTVHKNNEDPRIVMIYTDTAPLAEDQVAIDTAIITHALESLKNKKIKELRQACKRDIGNGFASDAMGSVHWYDAEEVEDQINLIGAVTKNTTIPFYCTDVSTGIKSHVVHTAQQIKNVFNDGVAVKQSILTAFHTSKYMVQIATTTEEVEAIMYTSPRSGIQTV